MISNITNNGLKVNVIKGASMEAITSSTLSCLDSKNTAIEKATEAMASASSASASEAISIAKASEASVSASSSSMQASIATAQAVISTTKASEASVSASASSLKANEASSSASSALTSKMDAATSEENALSYKNSASVSAATATNKASEASDSVDVALAYQYGAESAYNSTLSLVNNLVLPSVTHTVDMVDDFGTVPSGIYTAIVKDLNRGGTFIYDATQSTINNGGTVFDGWTRQYSGAVNVKWFGAVGDGITDDTSAIQYAIVYVRELESGGTVFLPSGNYVISETLIVEPKAQPDSYRRVNIVGEGSSNCTITYNGTGTAMVVRNYYYVSGAYLSNFKLSGFSLISTNSLYSGNGLNTTLCAWFTLEDIKTNGFFTGYISENSLGGTLTKCTFNNNQYGLVANQTNLLPPNAFNLYDCIISSNRNIGAVISNCIQFNFIGGDIEANGWVDSSPRSGGVSVDKTSDTPINISFTNVYFEQNANYGDFSFVNGDFSSDNNINFDGCSFVRYGVDLDKFSSNNIRLSLGSISTSITHLSVNNCTFNDAGGFVENSSYRHIDFLSTGGVLKFEENNNSYTFDSHVSNLEQYSTKYQTSNKVFGSLNGNDNTLFREYNISTHTKIGTGHYKVTFERNIPSFASIAFSTYSAGVVCSIWGVTETYLEFECLNNTNKAVDCIVTFIVV